MRKWTAWLNRSTSQPKPEFPSYPALAEGPFKPEYESLRDFFYQQLRPLLFEGHISKSQLELASRKWQETVDAIVKRMGDFDCSNRPHCIAAIDNLFNAAKHQAIEQIMAEAPSVMPGKPLTVDSCNQAIETLNTLFNTHIWPSPSVSKGR